MPCYLFTWHTYGSWLPDRPQGYVHWSRGREPTNRLLAVRYRQQQAQPTAELSEQLQQEIIAELVAGASVARYRLHFATTDATHVHVLASWRDERRAEQLRRSLRRSMSLRLNRIQRRKWFSRGGCARPVLSQSHFDHLVANYLPRHRGWKWCEGRGLFR